MQKYEKYVILLLKYSLCDWNNILAQHLFFFSSVNWWNLLILALEDHVFQLSTVRLSEYWWTVSCTSLSVSWCQINSWIDPERHRDTPETNVPSWLCLLQLSGHRWQVFISALSTSHRSHPPPHPYSTVSPLPDLDKVNGSVCRCSLFPVCLPLKSSERI